MSGSLRDPRTQEFLVIVCNAPILNRVLIHVDPNNPPKELAELNSTVRSLVGGSENEEKPCVRVCENFVCGLPMYDTEQFRDGLPKVRV